jgi:hypothetical protein
MVDATSEMELYKPANPTPAGPSNIAMAFARTTPITMLAAEEPPTKMDDFKIWPYVDFSARRTSAG